MKLVLGSISLSDGIITQSDMILLNAVTQVEHIPCYELKDGSHIKGNLWGVYCEYCG